MPRFLTVCKENILVQSTNRELSWAFHWSRYTPPETFKHWFTHFVSFFSYAISLIENSINAKAEVCHGDPEKEPIAVLRINDPYEASILTLHLDLTKIYIHGNAVCSIPSISSLKIYEYGLRSISRDTPGIERPLSNTRYLAIADARRFGDSARAIFNELRKNGIEPEDSIAPLFNGLDENLYESLGAYLLRTKGYLVWHQANISDLLPPPY